MQQDIVNAILTDFSRHNEKKKAVDTLFQYLYFHLFEFGVFTMSEDIRSDFLLWLYPKLSMIIEGYRPERSIFPTYLRMSVTFYWKLFGRRKREQAAYTLIAQEDQRQTAQNILTDQEKLHTYELYAASPQPEYRVSAKREQAIQDRIKWKSRKKQIYARYLLLLACKSCFCINDRLLRKVAKRMEIPVRTVRVLIEQVKRQAGEKTAAYSELAARRDYYYIRYKSATMQLRAMDDVHAYVVGRLKTQQAYSYNRWQRFLKRTKEYDWTPSNRSLAKYLGVCRSTINSDLAELKKACYGEPCIFT